MRIRKTAGWILVAAGAALLAWTAVGWMRAGKEIGVLRGQVSEKDAELKATRKDLTAAGLLYKAHQNSQSSIPDSLRKETSAAMYSEGKRHRQAVWKLEGAERDIKLDITRLKDRESEASVARRARAIPTTAGAAGSLLSGVLLLLAARPRREAA
jgi:hypothetical protein